MFRMLLPKLLEQPEAINWDSINELYAECNLGQSIYSRFYANSKHKELQEKYDSQIRAIFVELIAWTMNFLPEAEDLALCQKWAILSENFQKFYDSKILQKQGKNS